MRPHTEIAPSTETATRARDALAALGSDQPVAISNATTGQSVPLPPEAANLVRQVLRGLAAGRPIEVTEGLAELTPNQAAEVLNVSRTYVIKLMDSGTLP